MTKEQVNIAIINGLKTKGHEVLKLNPDLLADFANITYKLLNIHSVVLQSEQLSDEDVEYCNKHKWQDCECTDVCKRGLSIT
ncbi:hypothetical protein [Algibacter lectus]|uniref:hypothetical protein n=1 Tax=Algibacter lectus TaxID=221126 RepID=UPI0026F290AB|nr:hypothetical protein [Algibacter lectus]MDO7138682.1 hypothetical protein [Algibacter lectus]